MRAIKLEKSDNQTKLRTPDRIEKSTFNFPFSLGSKIFYTTERSSLNSVQIDQTRSLLSPFDEQQRA